MGMGSQHWEQLQLNGTVELHDIIKWAYTEQKGGEVVELLEHKFKDLQVIEHYINNYKLKVSRD